MREKREGREKRPESKGRRGTSARRLSKRGVRIGQQKGQRSNGLQDGVRARAREAAEEDRGHRGREGHGQLSMGDKRERGDTLQDREQK